MVVLGLGYQRYLRNAAIVTLTIRVEIFSAFSLSEIMKLFSGNDITAFQIPLNNKKK